MFRLMYRQRHILRIDMWDRTDKEISKLGIPSVVHNHISTQTEQIVNSFVWAVSTAIVTEVQEHDEIS